MFKQYIHSITQADGYLIFSLIVFFTFFLGVSLYILFVDKKHLEKMRNLPISKNSLLFLAFANQDLESEKLYFTLVFIILVVTFLLLLGYLFLVIHRLTSFLKEKDNKAKGIVIKDDRTFWQKIAGLNIKSQEEDLLINESHDGIYELDNPAPFWFMSLFYGTILIAALYWVYYHVINDGTVMMTEYAEQNLEIDKVKADYIEKFAAGINAETVTFNSEPNAIASGKDLYIKNCVACHGALGEGGVGPNLTDPNWIHGGGINNIFKTITEGVPEKGMISWKNNLNPLQIQEVSSFIMTLIGTNPPNGKEPQGDVYTEDSSEPTETNAIVEEA